MNLAPDSKSTSKNLGMAQNIQMKAFSNTNQSSNNGKHYRGKKLVNISERNHPQDVPQKI